MADKVNEIFDQYDSAQDLPKRVKSRVGSVRRLKPQSNY